MEGVDARTHCTDVRPSANGAAEAVPVTGTSFYELRAAQTRHEGAVPAGNNSLLGEVARLRDRYLAKMDDDFNTGGAISELFELVRCLNKFADTQKLEEADQRDEANLQTFQRGVAALKELCGILGLFLNAPATANPEDSSLVDQIMNVLVNMRADARKNKDFALADRIRDDLNAIGITLEDRKGGTGWRKD